MAQASRRSTEPTRRSFDSLAYAKHMESAGFTRQQAEALAEEQAKLIDERLTTKEDLEQTRLALKSDTEQTRLLLEAKIEQVRRDLEAKIEQVRLDLEAKVEQVRLELDKTKTTLEASIRESELRVTIRLGTMIFALGGILLAVKFFG